MDQRGLVERARGGDHDAFAELAREAVVRLDRAARLILRDPELARDAVQEGLIRAWRDLPKLRDPDRFDAWLYRLTVNACLDQARRRRRRVVEVELTPIYAPATSDGSRAHADRDEVDRVLQGLDEGGRAIVVLHYYVGMPLTDVAATLAIPVGTVKSRLHRALTEMRVAIDADFDHGRGSDLRRAAGMTTELRLTTELPEILGELAMGPYPEYIDDVLATTAEVRQRSAWTFPERWLPMVDATRRSALVPGFPWRSFSTAMLLLALLLAAVAIYLGSQQRIPPPFGPARNGLIAYAEGGDIFMADPGTGMATAIVSGPEEDVGPRFSLDGTLVAFERKVDSGSRSQVFVVRSDGSGLTLVTPEHFTLAPGGVGRAWERYEFSPDGKTLLIASSRNGYATLTIAQTDGTGVRELDLGMAASEPSFRPPYGAEILFIGIDGYQRGLFAVDPTTGNVRQILLLAAGFDLAGASWSPDGSHIAYWSWGGEPGNELNAATHVIAADGTGDRELPSPPDAVWNAHATWSNDGTKLFIARAYTGGFDDVRGVVIPADGSSVGVEVARSVETACCAAWMWSPDDSKLLGRSASLDGATGRSMLIDIAAKQALPAAWTASDPTWQRLAR